uniref:Uncharacterized protein n=1 Tax=Anguilla anguilla TaxID=7936 RepID=A0A0E9WZU9_ANGAN
MSSCNTIRWQLRVRVMNSFSSVISSLLQIQQMHPVELQRFRLTATCIVL